MKSANTTKPSISHDISSLILSLIFVAAPVFAVESLVERPEDLLDALEDAVAGDQVLLAPGAYSIGRFETRTGGSEGQPITERAVKPGTALINVRRSEYQHCLSAS